uniref:DUF6808 domain-containing protein n=1 Tax=Alistipes sp. TaxID=1872444 RepID=UPI0040565540
MRDLAYLIVIFALLAVLLFSKEEEPETIIKKEVHIDTIVRYAPSVSERKDLERFRVNVPRILFFHKDSIVSNDPIIPLHDSVEMEIEVDRRVYRDSMYEAQVSGPVIGPYGPTLDYIKLFNQTTTNTIFLTPRKWFEVNAETGVFYVNNTADAWLGVSANRHNARWSYGGSIGCTTSGKPFVQVRVGFRIWSDRGS